MFYGVSIIGHTDQDMETIVSYLLADSPKIDYNNRCHVAPIETINKYQPRMQPLVVRQCLVGKIDFS